MDCAAVVHCHCLRHFSEYFFVVNLLKKREEGEKRRKRLGIIFLIVDNIRRNDEITQQRDYATTQRPDEESVDSIATT